MGARAISRGGLRSLRKLSFPGGLLLGCDAGVLDPSRHKGTHAAMKSALLAAEVVARALAAGDTGGSDVVEFEADFRGSWLHADLERAQRYRPAAVYEIVETGQRQPELRINAGNCIHCKACDIKDPAQNIRWVPPEGGSGPYYANL